MALALHYLDSTIQQGKYHNWTRLYLVGIVLEDTQELRTFLQDNSCQLGMDMQTCLTLLPRNNNQGHNHHLVLSIPHYDNNLLEDI